MDNLEDNWLIREKNTGKRLIYKAYKEVKKGICKYDWKLRLGDLLFLLFLRFYG
jgi:IS1 family transposase